MKISFGILFLVVTLFNSVENEVDVKYCKAVKYINNSKDLKKSFNIKNRKSNYFKISDQIITARTFTPFFKKELKEVNIIVPDTSMSNLMNDILISDTTLIELSSNDSAEIIVYFSEISGNYLFAEILHDTNLFSDKYEDLTQFNVSKVVLFVFDKNSNIIKTFIKEFNYN